MPLFCSRIDGITPHMHSPPFSAALCTTTHCGRLCFGLVFCDKLLIDGSLRQSVHIFVLCLVLETLPKLMCQHPPHISAPAVPPLQRIFFRCHLLSDDCCVWSPNSSHLRLRPWTCASLYFSMCLMLMPQMREQHVARAAPAPQVC